MVVCRMEVRPKVAALPLLKFGIDRILSPSPSPSPSDQAVEDCSKCDHLQDTRTSANVKAFQLSNFRIPEPYYSQTIYVPQPLRPFTNVILPTESRLEGRDSESSSGQHKRKRSWSRAVFSNLQRKGLEKRFQLQKYITKPDRRQLAATLGLTDAQVKVWFQNRRMKWRHAKEGGREGTIVSGSSGVDVKPVAVSGSLKQISCLEPDEPDTLSRSRNCTDSDSDSEIDIQTVDT